MKKMIEKIRAAKTWQERAELAKNEKPATAFDRFFELAEKAKEFEKLVPEIARQNHQWLGANLTSILLAPDGVSVLNSMARALAEWKRPRKPDHALSALFALTGLFPPGWRKSWGMVHDPKTGKPIRVWPAFPRGTRDKVAMRDIKESLLRRNPNMTAEEWEIARKKIQRYVGQFRIPLDTTPGRPAKQLRHNQGHKAG